MFKRIFSSIPGLIVIASFAAAAMKLPAFARSERLSFSDNSHVTAVGRARGSSFASDRIIRRGFEANANDLLEVELKTGGEIQVSGWDNDSIDVVATLQECSESGVSFEETAEGLRISTSAPRRNNHNSCDSDFEIKVPNKQRLRFTTMGGDIRVDNVEGRISGKTMGGELDLSNLKGELALTTMGGDINLVKSTVEGSVKTMGGKVLLEDVIGGVKGESMGGDVVYRRVTNPKMGSTGNEVRIKTMGGDINVDDAPDGADVHTMGGKITVQSAAKFVKALTMGGEIEIREIDGRVDATTMGGDIEVTMVGDPKKGDRSVILKSYSGDISLVVPEGLSMDVDIELSFTRGHEGDYEIVSDFPLKQRTSAEWIRDKGDPRKILYGIGAVGGGKHKIVIETINGNVHLQKAKGT